MLPPIRMRLIGGEIGRVEGAEDEGFVAGGGIMAVQAASSFEAKAMQWTSTLIF